MKKERWEENTAFTNEALRGEYGDFAFESDDPTGPSAAELDGLEVNENDSLGNSIVPDDPANWDQSIRLPSVLTQDMVDSLYQMYGGADYFLGREDMRIFTGVDGKPIKQSIVNGYTIEPGMNALLYAQAMGYEEADQLRADFAQTEW